MDEEEYIFDAVTTCITYIFRLLRAVSSVSARASVHISSDGLKISVDNAHSCNGMLHIVNAIMNANKNSLCVFNSVTFLFLCISASGTARRWQIN